MPPVSPPERPTPLGRIAVAADLRHAPRRAFDRVADEVAFDAFVFEHDLLVDDSAHPGGGLDVRSVRLERGERADGLLLAVASTEVADVGLDWVAIQSRRGDDLLGLDTDDDTDADTADDVVLGTDSFDTRFRLDVDDESLDEARAVLTEAWCGRLAELDDESGPLAVVIETSDDGTSRMLVGRIVDVADDEAFVETIDLVVRLCHELDVSSDATSAPPDSDSAPPPART